MATTETGDTRPPSWTRPTLATVGSLVVGAVLLAAARLPGNDATVRMEVSVMAASTVALIAVVWWLAGRTGTADQRIVLAWGLGSGLILGALWIAEIAFNNLTPPTVSAPGARGVLDNVTWAIVGAGTVAAAAAVTARTRQWRAGLRAGTWSGVGSGLGAALGGAVLLAFLRQFVEHDPLMRAEWRQRGAGVDLSVYVTRETMAGVFGHLWVLGVVQGALLGALASAVTAAVIRSRLASRHQPATSDAG
jgi:hypothetical protein